MSVRFFEHADRMAQADALADLVAADLAARRGEALLAVPGGSTPRAFLVALARRDVDWRRVLVSATDERWVPPDDDRSNEGMIRAALGDAARIAPIYREDEAIEAGADAFSRLIEDSGPISTAVLGMGADMHCASLFPGAAELAAAMAPDAPLAAVMTPAGGLEPRVTLTARALAGAKTLVLLINGDEKRAAWETALATADPLAAPVGAVMRSHPAAEVRWAP